MTFDVSAVTVWKLQAVSFRHLIALALARSSRRPSPGDLNSFGAFALGVTYFQNNLKKKVFLLSSLLLQRFFRGKTLPLLDKTRVCLYSDDLVPIPAFFFILCYRKKKKKDAYIF